MKIRVMEIRGVGCCKGGKAPHRLYPRNARFFATAPAAGHGIADRGPRMSGWRRLGQAGNKRLAGAVLAVRRDRRREAAGDAGVRVPPAWTVLAVLDHRQFFRAFVLSIGEAGHEATTAPASSGAWWRSPASGAKANASSAPAADRGCRGLWSGCRAAGRHRLQTCARVAHLPNAVLQQWSNPSWLDNSPRHQ